MFCPLHLQCFRLFIVKTTRVENYARSYVPIWVVFHGIMSNSMGSPCFYVPIPSNHTDSVMFLGQV